MKTTLREPAGITKHNLADTVALLARTPMALDALLRDLPGSWTLSNEGEGTWNVFEVIAHLNHCERTDWLTRAKMILQLGESRAFDPLDRTGYLREMQGKQLGQLLDEFASLRSANLGELRGLDLQPAQLELRGQHPVFGGVTLSELLAAWAVHDFTHLHQLSRIIAHRYREAVGPWSAYLGVLQCAGHSS